MIRFEGHKTANGTEIVLRLFKTRKETRIASGNKCAVIGIGPGFAYLGEGGAYFDEDGEIPDWWALDESLRTFDGEPDATHFRQGDWWASPRGTRYLVSEDVRHVQSEKQVALRPVGKGSKKWVVWDAIKTGWTREAWGGQP